MARDNFGVPQEVRDRFMHDGIIQGLTWPRVLDRLGLPVVEKAPKMFLLVCPFHPQLNAAPSMYAWWHGEFRCRVCEVEGDVLDLAHTCLAKRGHRFDTLDDLVTYLLADTMKDQESCMERAA